MKFKVFTLLKNFKFSPERTSMEAITAKKELKQEIRQKMPVCSASWWEGKGNSIGATIPNSTEVLFKNWEENKVLRRKKDSNLARPKYHTKGGIFPFLILLQNYLHVPGGLVTPKGNNIQWFYQNRENKKWNQAFCGIGSGSWTGALPQHGHIPPSSGRHCCPACSGDNSSCQGLNLHQLPWSHLSPCPQDMAPLLLSLWCSSWINGIFRCF